ncbi:MAG: heparan-alpha-glucosaminide N-acetyltransferase domain-containing protein [Asgard group archaeon]|nr:heparan-alpha-glucosaminide N-acetyltransferase domain-containing protein [Asgard group archaeon]
MSAVIAPEEGIQKQSKRFLTLDIGRGLAILFMLILHIVSDVLDIDTLLADFNSIPLFNLIALLILPFLGGLAGFFLLISATGNMVSIYRRLHNGQSIKKIVLKQVIGGIILLIFAMLSEAVIGYHGVVGSFFKNLNNPAATNWQIMLWRWNTFETVHTIAWCMIINGLVQGALSLKDNWKNTKRMVISYAVLIVLVIGLTQPVWDLVDLMVPGYPFGEYPNGHDIFQPWIGYESFWHLLRAPFLAPLAAPVEPIFPYLAVSFFGSIIGIIISQPKEKISKEFPKKIFLVGLGMFIAGMIGIVFILMQIMAGDYGSVDSFDVTIAFYKLISFHRHWAPDAAGEIYPGVTVDIPPFSWLAQFSALTGFGIMLLMFLFRFIEFRGKGDEYAKYTKTIRRYGVVAFSNYNNQWIYNIVFCVTSLLITQQAYKRLLWGGTILTLVITLIVFSLLLWGWEKIRYIGSLKWFIRTLIYTIVPVKKQEAEEEEIKWWQKGQIDVERNFYNVDWIALDDAGEKPTKEEKLTEMKRKRESNLALTLSLVGIFSGIFIVASLLALPVVLNARKINGESKKNTVALVLSIIGCVLLVGGIIASFFIPVGALGLF